MRFEWDENKSQSNSVKHSVSFEVAASIFDNKIIMIVDDRKSYGETRYIVYGIIVFENQQLVLTLAITFREDNIRIISARKAKNRERRFYYEDI